VTVAFNMQYAMRMRHIVIFDCPAVKYFSTLSHKRHYLKKFLNITRKFWFSLRCVCVCLCVWNISHSKKNWTRYYKNIQAVQLKSGPYFNMSNLFTKIYMLYYTTNLYLQSVLEMISIHFNALIDTFHHVFLAFFHLLLRWHG